MKLKIKDVNINYVFYDNDSKINLVYLHGWGQNIEMMEPIAKPFEKKYNVLIIDLPGFGLSDEPKEVWSIFDYAEVVNEIIKKYNIKNPIMIGHSFGGKITLTYAAKYDTKKIVLLASPYRKSMKKPSMKTRILKSLKKVPILNKLEGFAKKHIGSTDYRNASEKMRQILVKHVNLDISKEVKSIKCPAVLIWGTDDTEVPYEDAIYLEKIMQNAGLVTYDGCTHYAYLERVKQTINILKSFIGSDE